MISDFRSLGCPDVLEADLCIIGAGPAGITIARELADTPWRVCLLESGGLRCERDSQALNAGFSVGPHALDPAASRLRVLGGATRVWGGGNIPLSSHEMARRDWVPGSGWPIGWDELKPYYTRANSVCGVDQEHLEHFEDGSYQSPRECLPPAPTLSSRFCRVRPMDFGEHYLPLLQSTPNLHVVLHANLLHLQATGDARAVQHALIGSTDGRRGQVRARCFVLAAGGIENARLLLLSDDVMHQGIGNARDLVGRYFMDHPRCGIGTFRLGQVELLGGLRHRPLDRAAALASVEFSLSDHVQRNAELLHARFRPFAMEASSPGMQSLRQLRASLRKEPQADENTVVERTLLEALAVDLPQQKSTQDAGITRARLALRSATRGHEIVKAISRRLARRPPVATDRVEMVGYFEQAPNRTSRVTLSDQRDALGLRQVQVDWRLDRLDLTSMRSASLLVGQDVAGQFGCRFDPAPWLQVPDAPPPVQGTAHHLGTTRMSDDPAEGVVDRQCRVHDVDNLYVAGSSVFPTGGWSFPTLTICALAIRLADELRLKLAELPTIPL